MSHLSSTGTKHSALTLGSQHVTKVMARGTLLLIIILELLLVSYGIWTNNFQFERATTGIIVILYMLVSNWAVSSKRYSVASIMLISLYFLLAISCLLLWGINSASGLLALSFIIFLSGTLLGIRAILPAGILCILSIVAIHSVHSIGIFAPNRSVLAMESHIGDIVTYSTLLAIFSLITWIVSFNLNTSFSQLYTAKRKLRQQKMTLATKLEEESRKLRESQLAEIQQLYAFARIGQSTTAILHELANQLSILTFDINGLSETKRPTKTIRNAQDSIKQINKTIHAVRGRINSRNHTETFNAIPLLRQTTNNTQRTSVSLSFQTSIHKACVKGDPINLSHVLTILLNNARDACTTNRDGSIVVHTSVISSRLHIDVSDNGPGLPEAVKRRLFQPHASSKADGMGIGLYIAKHIVMNQLAGTLKHDDRYTLGTRFHIELPLIES